MPGKWELCRGSLVAHNSIRTNRVINCNEQPPAKLTHTHTQTNAKSQCASYGCFCFHTGVYLMDKSVHLFFCRGCFEGQREALLSQVNLSVLSDREGKWKEKGFQVVWQKCKEKQICSEDRKEEKMRVDEANEGLSESYLKGETNYFFFIFHVLVQ